MGTRGIVSRGFANSVNSMAPPRTGAPLLLTGDQHYISEDGKSHTVYKLKGYAGLHLEEAYDIEKARKRIRLVNPIVAPSCKEDARIDLFSFELQEISNGYKLGSGTGSMTWESSVAMSLYFTENPQELKGNLIELGSGVGLGAILSKVAKELSPDEDDLSVTCTDVNDDILEMLEQNMDKAAASNVLFENDNIHIEKLDWFDYVGKENITENGSKQYDTIIASDCAYLKSQVNPLSETISQLLGTEAKLHMFAPTNRTVVYELANELKESKQMKVEFEDIELFKNRVRADVSNTQKTEGTSCSISRFLHITAWHENKSFDRNITGENVETKNIYDID